MSPFPREDYASLTRYTPDRRPVTLDLSDNTNLWGAHPDALERIRAASADDLARYPELYADVLRTAVAERFEVDVECVTTGAGSDDVLDSAFRAAGGPGATVAYAGPTFSMVEPLAVMNGMVARAVPWRRALGAPELLLEGEPSVVYVCRPNNPTGERCPAEWIDRLLEERSRRPGAPPLVVLDEAYADFDDQTLAPVAPRHGALLVARTTSKAYGLAGLRCGFAVGRPDVALEVEKSRGPYKVSRLAAEAAAAALRDRNGWMAGTVEECRRNRERLSGELTARGLAPLDSRANFLLFPAPGGSASSDALTLRERGVAVRPFAGALEGGRDGLRVTVGPWSLMERFLSALDDVAGQWDARAGQADGEVGR